MNVGGIEAGGGENIGIHGGAEREVASDADSYDSEASGAIVPQLEIVEGRSCVGIVSRYVFGYFVRIAFLSAGIIVSKDAPAGFQFVIDLRDYDDIALAGQPRACAPNGTGDLENFRKENDAGIFSARRRPKYQRAHRARGRGDFGRTFGKRHDVERILLSPRLTDGLWDTRPNLGFADKGD